MNDLSQIHDHLRQSRPDIYDWDCGSPEDWQDDDSTRAIKGILAGIGLSLPMRVVIGAVIWAVFK